MPTISETKKLFIDIETGLAPDANLFEPKYKEPRMKKDGTPYADSKTIEEQKVEWESKCALSPLTGQVLMVGYHHSDTTFTVNQTTPNKDKPKGLSEEILLIDCVSYLNNADLIIGHYIKDFDLPFIINRCRKHGITPPNVGYRKGSKWYWNENVIDLRDLWTLGKYNEHISLNNMAKYFGLIPKDETIGENFQQVFDTDIERAIQYCKYDVELTKQIYAKLT